MRETVNRAVQARLGGKVERCHNIPHHGSYSNAAHSWGVAMLLRHIWPEDTHLLIHALVHDIPEGWVGDIPSPTLRNMPEFRSRLERAEGYLLGLLQLPDPFAFLSEEDLLKLKTADRLEFVMWCMEQTLLGNRYAEEALKEMHEFAMKDLPPKADEFYAALVDRHQNTTYRLLPVQAGMVYDAVRRTE